jgi:hypothetical protein
MFPRLIIVATFEKIHQRWLKIKERVQNGERGEVLLRDSTSAKHDIRYIQMLTKTT